jgi:hypothetical protein
MGNLRGGPEQDKEMERSVAGAPEEAPRPMVPPLRVDTSMFRAGYRGIPWDKGDPSAVPPKDSRKSHITKPNPFKERKDFYKFIRSAYLYTTVNPGEFPTNKLKVMFYLSYMERDFQGSSQRMWCRG